MSAWPENGLLDDFSLPSRAAQPGSEPRGHLLERHLLID